MAAAPTLLWWLLAAVGFGVYAVRRRSLSPGGALAAGALGIAVIATAGWPWLLPLLAFFISSTVLGRLLPAAVTTTDAKDHQPRDAVQVICNGGVYGLVAAAGLDPVLLLVPMAVATADTWASEIGKYYRQPTYDILLFQAVPPGLSGGVSVAGTVGGAAGAGLVGMLGWVLLPDYTTALFLSITALGFGGMLVDSVLGAGLQARYRTASGRLSDEALPDTQLISGRRWMTNDLVNLIAIAATTAVALGLEFLG
ncbi:uncharacterized protein (TIGR00297 family) [Lewinella marina]|uniref:DUF92 domain-containing protein n=1 Tax=Neolewinella marina TaxID=438751 RepID=UPI001430ED7D|nr:DUF92 domain-containing protein [Neolewinella marina]NJB85010.1 uncharacterized protein (TIGR00297 family) [Neolewinella marina]